MWGEWEAVVRSPAKYTAYGITSVFASILLTVMVIACSSPTIQLVVTPTPTVKVIVPPALAHKTIIFCDDETGSYSPDYFHAAAAQVAAWVQGVPQANTSGATVYVQWIE